MALHIFGNQDAPARKRDFADDVVGKFRSGYTVHGRPQALTEWRVTSDDPAVTERLADLYGGNPQTWESRGTDDQEVFTETASVDVILEGAYAIRQRMLTWSRNGKIIFESDGAVQPNGDPDPDADLSLAERKAKARDGLGPEPSIDLTFRLADDPELGIFRFHTGSWSMASDLAYDGTEERLIELAEDGGAVRATLELEQVSFTAKSGPRAGQTVSYTKPHLRIKGVA